MSLFKSIQANSDIILELNDGGSYRGIFKTYSSKFKYICLIQSVDITTGKKCNGPIRIYETEIESIEVLRTPPQPSDSLDSVQTPEIENESIEGLRTPPQPFDSLESVRTPDGDENNSIDVVTNDLKVVDSDDGSENQLHSECTRSNGHGKSVKPIRMQYGELEEIDTRIRSAVYIPQCDASYHAALDDLRCQEIIGLNIKGARMGRLTRGSVLAMSTPEKIYLFDLILLGSVFPEMKVILESQKPRKVVHDSCFIVDHLTHKYQCQLNGFDDTLVMHMLNKNNKSRASINGCLRKYFCLNIPRTPKQNWDVRPLSRDSKIVAACSVAYSIKLFLHLNINTHRPVNELTEKYSKSYARNEDEVDVFDQMSNRRNPGLILFDRSNIQSYYR